MKCYTWNPGPIGTPLVRFRWKSWRPGGRRDLDAALGWNENAYRTRFDEQTGDGSRFFTPTSFATDSPSMRYAIDHEPSADEVVPPQNPLVERWQAELETFLLRIEDARPGFIAFDEMYLRGARGRLSRLSVFDLIDSSWDGDWSVFNVPELGTHASPSLYSPIPEDNKRELARAIDIAGGGDRVVPWLRAPEGNCDHFTRTWALCQNAGVQTVLLWYGDEPSDKDWECVKAQEGFE